MTTYLYKPEHPMANKQGFITKDDFYMHKFYMEPDLRMIVGNKPIQIYYNKDEMEPIRHMINGKYYTSKKKFRDETKARGCIEIGNETSTLLKPRKYIETSKKQRREDIKKAIYELKNGKRV